METTGLGYWILLVLVGLAGVFVGYRIGLGRRRQQREAAFAEKRRLQASLEDCQQQLQRAHSRESLNGAPFDPQAAREALGRPVYENDLKLVEGIGPKIEGLFHNFDIKSWKHLSEASVDKCREVLESGGDRFRVHDPASWPMQAGMAYQGQWESLARWQKEHKHGKL